MLKTEEWLNDDKIPVVIEQNLSSSVELIPSFKEVSFMFEESSINGEIRFMNYYLTMFSRQSIKLYTDIFIIIGLNNLYKELNTLVAVGASCFSKTESITYALFRRQRMTCLFILFPI